MKNVLKGGRTNPQNTYSVNLSQDVPVPAFWVVWIKSNLEQMLSHNMLKCLDRQKYHYPHKLPARRAVCKPHYVSPAAPKVSQVLWLCREGSEDSPRSETSARCPPCAFAGVQTCRCRLPAAGSPGQSSPCWGRTWAQPGHRSHPAGSGKRGPAAGSPGALRAASPPAGSWGGGGARKTEAGP